jgi:DNA-binding beta-propeller fold protein YncE
MAGILGTWKNALLDPKRTFASEKKGSSIKKGLVNLGLSFAIFACIYLVLSLFGGAFSPLYLALLFFLVLLFDILMWILARVLGSKGKFAEHFYLCSIFLAPLFILSLIPWLGLLPLLYCVYLSFILMDKLQGIRAAKAWPAVVVPVLVVAVAAVFLLPVPRNNLWLGQPGLLPSGSSGQRDGSVTTTTTSSISSIETTIRNTGAPTTTSPYNPSLYVWVVGLDGSGHSVTKLQRSNGREVGTYNTGTGPRAVAMDPTGNVWVANSGVEDNTVTKLDGATGRVLGTFKVGFDPEGIAADGLGNVWVSNKGDDTVTKLDSSGKTVGTYSVVGRAPYGIAVDRDNNVWVANTYSPQSVTKLDGTTGAVLANIPMFPGPNMLAADSQGNVWVSAGYLFKLDSQGKIVGNESGYQVYNAGVIAIDSYDNVWTTDGEGVVKLSPQGERIGTYLTGVPGGNGIGISADEDGNIWVVVGGGGTSVFKLAQDGRAIGNYSLDRPTLGNPAISIGDMTGFALKHAVLSRAP